MKDTQSKKEMGKLTDVAERASQLGSFLVTSEVRRKFVPFEAPAVNTSDTITISDLTTIQDVALVKKSDGTVCTRTFATNVITVTQTLAAVDLVGVAIGV